MINIEKELFDKEYSCQFIDEMKYLKSKGIKYTFVKSINGITTYKYTKTSDLFSFLAIFYAKKEAINNEENKRKFS